LGVYIVPYADVWSGGVKGGESFSKSCDVTHEIAVRIDGIILLIKEFELSGFFLD
jgi:hypothetical protein